MKRQSETTRDRLKLKAMTAPLAALVFVAAAVPAAAAISTTPTVPSTTSVATTAAPTTTTVGGTLTNATATPKARLIEWDLPAKADSSPGAMVVDSEGRD